MSNSFKSQWKSVLRPKIQPPKPPKTRSRRTTTIPAAKTPAPKDTE